MSVSVADEAITVVGAARSGRAVARLLADAGANVFLTEHGPPPEDVGVLHGLGVATEFDGHTDRALEADVMVLSPGVPTQADLVQRALQQDIHVVSEIEAASWFCTAPIVAITGTNGKTTTTRLTAHLLRTALPKDRRVIVAGNIGTAFSEVVANTRPQDVVVLEVSSFQLDHVHTFRPRVGAYLNLTADHLNRYNGSMDAYAQAKANIMRQQGAGDVIIYGHDDDTVRALVAATAADAVQRLPFSQHETVDVGAFVEGSTLVIRTPTDEIRIPQSTLALPGPHNVYNAQAAVLAVTAFGGTPDAICRGLSTIEPVPHRMEPVGTVEGIQYVNDSKATNVDAVRYALQSFDRPIVLIAGGRDKGNDYRTISPLLQENVHTVISLGESAPRVEDGMGPFVETCVRAVSLHDAVQQAHTQAHPGDVVLLSPACSSFDMFTNYKDRGNRFREYVRMLRTSAP